MSEPIWVVQQRPQEPAQRGHVWVQVAQTGPLEGRQSLFGQHWGVPRLDIGVHPQQRHSSGGTEQEARCALLLLVWDWVNVVQVQLVRLT